MKQLIFLMLALVLFLPDLCQSTTQPKKKVELVHVNLNNIQEVLHSSRYIVMDVYTNWCGPCRYLAPIILDLHKEVGHLYHFVKLDAEKDKMLARNFKVSAFPTIIFFEDGKEVGRHKGYMDKEEFLRKIEQFFPAADTSP